MNITTVSNSSQIVVTIKASVYLVDFITCLVLTILITQTVWRDNVLKREVQYFLLCQHLLCLTLFFGIGTIFSFIRAFQVYAPVLVCWIIFAVKIIVGRGLMMTLVLMALNTCVAVCWPLKYLTLVHSVKCKINLCLWIIAFLDPAVSIIYESIKKSHEFIVSLDPTCPTTLSNALARISGVVFIILLVILILMSNIIMYREGIRAGHFTNSSKKARKTLIIHGLQIGLHILPTLVNISIGGMSHYEIIDLTSFIIFSFAQCLSPVVYGLRYTELRHKLIGRHLCCEAHVTARYGEETNNS